MTTPAHNLPRSVMIDLLSRADAIRTHSCCGIEDKFCNTDEWKVNMESLIKTVWRAAQEDMILQDWSITRRPMPPFNRIEIKAPNGYVAVVDQLDSNPANILYMLADALLNTTEE